MQNVLDQFAKILARFYNWIPKEVKVPMFVATSALIATLGALLVDDLRNGTINNPYLASFIPFIIALITTVINYVQKKLVDLGESLLAGEGNEKVISNLEDKIVQTENTIAGK